MSSTTYYLHLKCPSGSKYWNYDTWCYNMEILAEKAKEIETIILDNLQAVNVDYNNTTSGITGNNVQAAIDDVARSGSWVKFADVTSATNFEINANACCHLTVSFGPSVPAVSFTNRANRQFNWINGYPTFEPNSVYELSFLDLGCIWVKRDDMDWSRFFGYHITNNICYVNYVKVDEWVGYFHNGDVIVPSYIEGYPVQIELIN